VLFEKRFWEPIQSGRVTVTFRRWKRCQVVAGRVYRTPAGRLHVTSVDVVAPEGITDRDATAAGYPDVATVVAALRDTPGAPVYRIAFRYLNEPDPRALLADNDDLTDTDVEEITGRLDRLDRASSHGPWTRAYLETIEANPERRAPDLAEMFGRETQPFKTDIRKLKNLGLTLSFRIGYRLSPRGREYLDRVRRIDG
jgi:hypothetical protein